MTLPFSRVTSAFWLPSGCHDRACPSACPSTISISSADWPLSCHLRQGPLSYPFIIESSAAFWAFRYHLNAFNIWFIALLSKCTIGKNDCYCRCHQWHTFKWSHIISLIHVICRVSNAEILLLHTVSDCGKLLRSVVRRNKGFWQ